MKNEIKYALYFIAGAACGAGGMWIGMSKYFRDKANAEIQDMKKYIDETYRPKKEEKNNDIAKKISDKAYKSHLSAEREMIDSYRKTISPNGTSYNTPVSDNVITEETKMEPKEDIPEEDEEREPYLISLEEYSDITPYYDKVTLVYDKASDNLTDIIADELVDVGETIGAAVWNMLDDAPVDSYIYVRNDKIGVDYEIEVRSFDDDDEM